MRVGRTPARAVAWGAEIAPLASSLTLRAVQAALLAGLAPRSRGPDPLAATNVASGHILMQLRRWNAPNVPLAGTRVLQARFRAHRAPQDITSLNRGRRHAGRALQAHTQAHRKRPRAPRACLGTTRGPQARAAQNAQSATFATKGNATSVEMGSGLVQRAIELG